MRVLKVMPGVDPGAGAEESFAATVPGLVELGDQVHLVLFTERQGLVPRLEQEGVVVHDLSSARSMLDRVRRLRRVVRSVRPDLVHATLWDAVVPAQLATWRSGVPVLVTWANVGNWSRGSGVRRTWKLRVVQALDTVLARVSGSWFHAVTPGVARVNAPVLRVPASRVRVVERGRPELTEVPDAAAVDELRGELGIDPSTPVALAVGRQEPQKNHVALVSALALEPARSSGLHVVLAGREGLSTTAILSAIEEHGLSERVHVLGHRGDVPALLALADVFVLPSLYEGAAGAAIEAMRSGTPIVSHRVHGLEGVLVHDDNSLLVTVGDAQDMSRALALVVRDLELAQRLAHSARATFEARFTLERSVQEMHGLYREIVASA